VARIVAGVGPPEDITTRLRRALGVALKARDADAVSALRSAMGAIGNAEAVGPAARPAGTGSTHFAETVDGLGAGEAQRRLLTEADIAAIVRQEAAEREAAAGEYKRAGRAADAARLREGARALMAALGC
jgi:uncharacterized protein